MPCDASAWLSHTDGNTAPARALIVDAWLGAGIGNSLMGTANWLQFASSALAVRSIRFAFCVPRSQQQLYSLPVPARSTSINRALTPACEEPHFDLHDHVTFDHLQNLKSVEGDFGDQTRIIVRPSCEQMLSVLRKRTPAVVAFVQPHSRQVARCIRLLSVNGTGDVTSASAAMRPATEACLGRLSLRAGHTDLPRCDVGLHVRTMSVDFPSCNLLAPGGLRKAGALSPATFKASGCPETEMQRWRYARGVLRRNCPSRHCEWPDNIRGCQKATSAGRQPSLFATADASWVYGVTRPMGWQDLSEHAVRYDHYQMNVTATVTTLRAWFTLANCRVGIVAPISSFFSKSASRAAGVPLHVCCWGLAFELSKRIDLNPSALN